MAIRLRKEWKLKESNKILINLSNDNPNNLIINYQCAWSFDVMGLEREAVPYYERAIVLGLPDEDLIKYKKAIEFYSDKLDKVWWY